jgi:hypothetical protein
MTRSLKVAVNGRELTGWRKWTAVVLGVPALLAIVIVGLAVLGFSVAVMLAIAGVFVAVLAIVAALAKLSPRD